MPLVDETTSAIDTSPRLMVVEDEGIIALHLRCQLEDLGFQVVGTASRGEDALALARSGRPDLMLMDIHLPGSMDGIDVATTLNQEMDVPVVFLSAYAEPSTLARAKAVNAYGYLVKPFETRELNATIHMALARHKAVMAVARSEARLKLALDAADMMAWEWDANNLPLFLDKVHADDRARVEEAFRQASLNREPLHIVFRERQHDGHEVRWTAVHGRLSDGLGSPSQLYGVARDVTELHRAEEKLRQMAHYDALTGLPNRVLFADRVAQAIIRSKRSNRPFSLVCLDLNGFKLINDTHGHAAGDLLLKGVADRLTQCARGGDTVARLGGDEFMIVAEGLNDARESANMCERILKSLERPIDIGDVQAVCGASLGVAAYPQDGLDRESLMSAADAAMYSAKVQGGNLYHFFSAELGERQAERARIERELRDALERKELLLHFQPQIGLDGRQVDAAEALLRWQHPERGLLSPHQFLPMAREAGLMRQVSRQVLDLACQAITELTRHGHRLRVAVNCSPMEIHADGYADGVQATLQEHGIDPSRLEIEVTEEAMLDPVRGGAKVNALRAMGVGVAVDDYGVGHSSLANLTKLQLTRLKIDRSLIEGLPQDDKGQAVVSTLIDLANTLKMHIVASGVETSEQLDCLRRLGKVGAQGYLLARPMPLDGLIQFLSNPQKQAV